MVQKNLKSKANSKEFEERKKLLELAFAFDEKKHAMKMQELEYIRQTDNIRHEKELERGRIKSAEIRKSIERKANRDFMESYHK
jgi:hypothetical protein